MFKFLSLCLWVKKVILFSWLEGAEVRYKSLTRGQEEGNKELLVTEGDIS